MIVYLIFNVRQKLKCGFRCKLYLIITFQATFVKKSNTHREKHNIVKWWIVNKLCNKKNWQLFSSIEYIKMLLFYADKIIFEYL